MAKKTINTKPDPQPKVGDRVNYVSPSGGNKVLSAKVEHVHEDHEGRLLNLAVSDPEGDIGTLKVPWREWALDDVTGNSWHWPEKEKAKE